MNTPLNTIADLVTGVVFDPLFHSVQLTYALLSVSVTIRWRDRTEQRLFNLIDWRKALQDSVEREHAAR
jgi:hypothetical protein